MNRKTAFVRPAFFFAGFLLAGMASTGLAASPAKRPNIIVILTDDQGRGDYSAFGTGDLRTPNLDRLFREGQTFDNFFANSPVCSPTRAALLSGRYPDRAGVPGLIREENPANSWGWLSPGVPLLPQQLKAAGYDCALIGKWNLGMSSPNLPNERGFDLFHGFLGDKMDDYWTHLRNGLNLMRHNGEVITPEGHATDLFTQWACAYLEDRARADRPFFLYLAYNAPHDPVQPPPAVLARVRAREPQLGETRARMVALLEHLDAGIGEVLQTLDRAGLTENTLVIFTSDNGGDLKYGANNGPWRSGKQHVYEGGLRVPGAARWPGVITPGSRTGRLTLTMDIFPTVCAIAGIAPADDIDGVSFLPALQDRSAPEPDRDLYFLRREGGPVYGGKTIEAFRRGQWKLLQDDPFSALELYDLSADPGETTNLASSRQPLLAELAAALRRQIQRGGLTPWQAPAAPSK